jgi:hypothetical protein
MSADPKTSSGARLEREAMRRYLRRALCKAPSAEAFKSLEGVLAWVMQRRARYDKASGGLGRK